MPIESVALSVKLNVPVASGVPARNQLPLGAPESRESPDSKAKPGGRAVRASTIYGGVPPLSERSRLDAPC